MHFTSSLHWSSTSFMYFLKPRPALAPATSTTATSKTARTRIFCTWLALGRLALIWVWTFDARSQLFILPKNNRACITFASFQIPFVDCYRRPFFFFYIEQKNSMHLLFSPQRDPLKSRSRAKIIHWLALSRRTHVTRAVVRVSILYLW